jgi:hypothetical protein
MRRPRTYLAVVLVCLGVIALPSRGRAETVPAAKAHDYVGKDVTVEGRIVAMHDSPLASVIAFQPNFAGFTATILAGDRAKFPADLESRYSGRLVQVSGTITAYRGKPEMTLRDPSQLSLVVDPNLTATPAAQPTPAAPPTPSADVEELRRDMASLDDRMGALEQRLGAIEQLLAGQAAQAEAFRATYPTPVSAVAGLGIGAGPGSVRQALGPPNEVRRGPGGAEVWNYGTGRTVTFDDAGRVTSWTGF